MLIYVFMYRSYLFQNIDLGLFALSHSMFCHLGLRHYLAAFARLDVEHRLVFNLMAREIARTDLLMYSYAWHL